MEYHRAKDRLLLLFVARRISHWATGTVSFSASNVVLGTSFVDVVRYTGELVIEFVTYNDAEDAEESSLRKHLTPFCY